MMYTHTHTHSHTLAIKQQYQQFYDLGAANLHMEILEVGSMGGDMAYDRGYIQVLNSDQNIMINGKYVRS